jgi:electron transport complex protein RnfG
MKPLKIVLMLTLTVVSLSLAVFLVEGVTSEIVEQRQAEEIEAALKTIFPAIDATNDDLTYVTDADFGISGITQVIEIESGGSPKGYVYTVEFTGYASTITYLMGVDATGTITGYQILSQGDTPGFGAKIAESDRWEQFTGMSIEMAGNGEFDGISGATVTTTGWKSSLRVVYEYHLDTYGYTPLTPEQIILAKKEALAGKDLVAYENENPFADYGIQSVHIDSDETVVVYEVEFVGFNANDVNEYLIAYDLSDHTLIGYETLYSGDSEDWGAARMNDAANWTQFEGLAGTDLLEYTVDGFAGVTVTGNALESSLTNVATYHRWEFEGIKVLTPEEQYVAYQEELFPNAVRFEEVTSFKPSNLIVHKIYDAYDASDNFVGTIYHVATIGASYSKITTIEFLVGIDPFNAFTGFRMLKDTETDGIADPFYADGYGDTIDGDDIAAAIGLDAVAGSTLTYTEIVAAMEVIAVYHVDEYLQRPDSVIVDNADLLAAFPTAVTFVSIYDDMAYNARIGNVYEAQDGSGNVLGHVYFAYASGYSGSTIEYTFGVASDGTTQLIHIVTSGQSWNDANAYGDYDGSFGLVFNSDNVWLEGFEAIDIATILTGPVDSVSGVTNTTGGMITSLETIAQYHQDETTGGGN